LPNSQGHLGPGEQGTRQGKNREGDSQAGGHAIAGGGPNLEGRHRRIVDLYGISEESLETDWVKQCPGMNKTGNQEANPGGWQLP